MGQPLVTIIVPVYKVEKYLRRCLDSIIAQTYTNFEVILVDDGSPDRCGEICDAYAAKDTRFRVIHQKNGGLSAARNSALNSYYSSARGYGYITFVDSDDYISPEMLDVMVGRAIAGGFDIVKCSYNNVERDGNIYYHMEVQDDLCDINEIRKRYLIDKVANSAWGVLFKQYLWETTRFPVGMLMEDFYTISDIIMNAKRVCILREPFYFYCHESDNGIMRTNDVRKVIRRHYGYFLGWAHHADLASKYRPQCQNFCIIQALHKAIRAGIMDQGINELSMKQHAIIRSFINLHKGIQVPVGLKYGGWLLLENKKFLLAILDISNDKNIAKIN